MATEQKAAVSSREALEGVAARAATLEERLNRPALAPDSDDPTIHRRLDRWREKAAKGDEALFARLMELRGLNAGRVRAALGPARPLKDAALPGWTEWFLAGVGAAESQPASPGNSAEAEPLPFERLFLSFARAAAERLRTAAGPACNLLSEVAHQELERALLRRLTGCCAASLSLELSLYRKECGASGAEAQQDSADAFIRHQLDGGSIAFFQEYCVLARAVANLMAGWVAFTAEFLCRLASDLESLREAFSPDSELGTVADIRASLSDPHDGGRTVLGVKFSSGLRIVYKPRSFDTDIAWNGLLEWTNAQGLGLPLKGATVLARPGYGWVGWIEYAPCADDAERARYYRRTGMLLAIFHVLGASDIHAENLIAAGEYPMPIDTETLMTPLFFATEAAPRPSTAQETALMRLTHSVLTTCMLPHPPGETGEKAIDMSGLGGVGGESVTATVPRVTPAGEVAFERSPITAPRHRNVPFPEGMAAEPSRFTESIVEGFREAYGLLALRRRELTAPDGPLAALARAPMRLVFRDTRVYGVLLTQSLAPQCVRDGVDRSLELESLDRIMLAGAPSVFYQPVVAAEKEALERLDIPYFHVIPGERAVFSGGRTVAAEFLREPPYEAVLRRIEGLDAAACEEEVRIVRGTFYCKSLLQGCRLGAPGARVRVSEFRSGREFFAGAAREVGTELSRRAVWGPEGGCTWLGMRWRPRANAFRFLPSGVGLYDGLGELRCFWPGWNHPSAGVNSAGCWKEPCGRRGKPLPRLWRSPNGTAPPNSTGRHASRCTRCCGPDNWRATRGRSGRPATRRA
jgi:type 2 lantibiotic biosynthesis protein LanM